MFIGDTDLSKLDDRKLTLLRRDQIGFIFQAFNLVPTLTALENITLPMALAGRKPDQAWLDQVVAHRRPRRPPRATARASSPVASSSASPWPGPSPAGRRSSSATSPPATSTPAPAPRSCRSCARPSSELGQTIVMVTHDPVAASYAERVVFLADGRIVDEMSAPTAERVLDRMKQLRRVSAMFRTTLKNLAARKLRLLTTSLAVLLGVAFMAGTLVLTDTIGKTFDSSSPSQRGHRRLRPGRGRPRQRAARRAAGPPRHLARRRRSASVDGVAAAEGHIEAYAQLVDDDGEPIGNPEHGRARRSAAAG